MHVIINGRFLNQSVAGVQRYSFAFVEHLDKMVDKWENLTFSIVSPKLAASYLKLTNIEIIEYGRLGGHLWEQLELPFYANKDLLLCLGNTAPILSLLADGCVATVVHDLAYRNFPKAYSQSFRAVYNIITPFIMSYSSAVIMVSETARQNILEYYSNTSKRLFVVHNGGLPDETVPDNTRPLVEQYLLYVGTFSKLKNFPAVIEIAQRILAQRKELYFVFIGGQKGILRSSNIELDKAVSTRILFLGQINDFKVLAQYYKHAQLLLFPSLSESSGLPPIEAMSFGCPVVVSDIPGLRERCGDAAVYCNPRDFDDIYQKVDEILCDDERRASLSKRGREHAKKFTWRNCVSDTLNIIRPLVQERRKEIKKYSANTVAG
jgi:glycosyltransferase involved in cell wall biosynthesis